MTRLMLIAVLGTLHAASLLANSYTYTTDTADTGEGSYQICGYYAPGCEPFELDVPEFNPVIGTLDSITFTFTDTQTVVGGVSALYLPADDTYSYTNTEGDTSTQLGIGVSATQTVNCLSNCSGFNISEDPETTVNHLVVSGTLTGAEMDAFIGTGYLALFVTPFLDAAGGVISSDGNLVGVVLYEVTDDASLQITYNDSPAGVIPEPRWISGFLALGFAVSVALRRSCSAARAGSQFRMRESGGTAPGK
jgi:hypothetical protein